MVTKFKRPEGLYPQIYHTFMAKDKDSEDLVEYCVQDLTENKYNVAIEFMIKNMVKEETFHRALKVYENENAVKSAKNFYRQIFKEKFSLVCFKLGSDEIVSVNALFIQSKGHYVGEEEKIDPFYEELKNVFAFIGKHFNAFERYKVDHYLTAVGLCVDPNYRNRGVATEMLKARELFMTTFENITVTSTIFTSIGSQKAAEKAGYEENFVISLKTIKEAFPNMEFSENDPNNCKTCSLKLKV